MPEEKGMQREAAQDGDRKASVRVQTTERP